MERPENYHWTEEIRKEDIASAEDILGQSFEFAELPKNPERIDNLISMLEVVSDWGRDLGVDLKNRLPNIEDFHFFSEFGYRSAERGFRWQSGTNGLCVINSPDMLIEESKVEIGSLSIANHELVHRVSLKSLNICNKDKLMRIGPNRFANFINKEVGVSDVESGALMALNEALTEMTNIELKVKYWLNHKDLSEVVDKEGYGEVSYLPLVIIFDEIFKHISSRSSKSYKEVFGGFQKAMLLGDKTAIEQLEEMIGRRLTKDLSDMPIDYSKGESMKWIMDIAEAIAVRTGDREIIDKLNDYIYGSPIVILENLADGGLIVQYGSQVRTVNDLRPKK